MNDAAEQHADWQQHEPDAGGQAEPAAAARRTIPRVLSSMRRDSIIRA